MASPKPLFVFLWLFSWTKGLRTELIGKLKEKASWKQWSNKMITIVQKSGTVDIATT